MKNNIEKQSFVKGAAVLALAGIAVKILGAVYKIPLGNLLGPVGMADFSIAYNIYALLFVLSTAGVPVSVSKLVSEERVRNPEGDAHSIYKIAYIAFSAVGLLGFLGMFFGAEKIAEFMGNKGSALSIKAIAPAVLFVSLSAVNRGYFQGRRNMTPTAVSEVIESSGKLLFGLIFVILAKRLGKSEEVLSACAVLGVSIGAFLSSGYFSFCSDKPILFQKRNEDNGKRIFLRIMRFAVPITIGSAMISLTNVIDSALVMNLLQKQGINVRKAKWLYGAYGYATTIFNLPSAVVTTVAVSSIPAMSALLAKDDNRKLNETAKTSFLISMLFAIPAASGMLALSYEICNLLYGFGADNACIAVSGRLLSYIAIAVVPLSITTVTTAMHQAFGHPAIPVISMAVGSAVKVISNLILVSVPSLNIYGAAISTVLCYTVIACFNIIALGRYEFLDFKLVGNMTAPCVCGVLTFFGAKLAVKMLARNLSGNILTVVAVISGVVFCCLGAFVTYLVGRKRKKSPENTEN